MSAPPEPPPSTGSYRLSAARTPVGFVETAAQWRVDPEGSLLLDLDIDANGRIAAIAPAGATPPRRRSRPVVDLGGAHVWAGTVDAHAHLDKVHSWARSPNPDGGSRAARDAVKADRRRGDGAWSAEDVRRRMDFALRAAYSHGVVAVRTHIDSQPGVLEPAWSVFEDLRDAWAGRIALQGVATLGAHKLDGAHGDAVAARMRATDGLLGPVLYHEVYGDAPLMRALDLAARYDIGLDFHLDECLDPKAQGLRSVATSLSARGWGSGPPVVCGHACSLSVLSPDDRDATIAAVARAPIGVVAAPMTNLTLQDRSPGRTPTRRGLTLLHELARAGVPLAVAGDNCRDAFHAFGDHDMVDVFRDAVRIAHLDPEIGSWARMIGSEASSILGFSGPTAPGRIAVGAPADLIVFRGRSFSEVLARPGAPRRVLRDGRAIDAEPPNYAELDEPVDG